MSGTINVQMVDREADVKVDGPRFIEVVEDKIEDAGEQDQNLLRSLQAQLPDPCP